MSPSLLTIAIETARAAACMLLPWQLVKLPSDAYITSFATGGEWVRLNSTKPACFGARTSRDSSCRYLAQKDCEANQCVFADPTMGRCVLVDDGDADCETLARRSCALAVGCSWEIPLDQRVKCRALPPTAPFGGRRCERVVANEPGAIDVIRRELGVLITQVGVFILGNVWLVRWFGSMDAVFANGKPLVVFLFGVVAIGGTGRLQYLVHDE